MADADGSNARRLTAGWKPVWSPDGDRIAYSDGGIWTMDADGGNPRLLAEAGADAAWSPDGRRIVYYESGPDRGVWVADADGGDRRWLVGGTAPVWSPDGKRIAYSDGGELLRDLGDGRGRRQPAAADTRRFEPAVVAGREPHHLRGSEAGRVRLRPLGGGHRAGGPRRLALKGDHPAWSPDGERIAYSRAVEQVPEIWVADAAGHRMVADGSGPVWSPDGDNIAYTRSDGEGIGLWVMAADGADTRRLARRGSEPAWSPDGRRIAYAGEGGAVWVAERDGGNGRQLTDDWRPNASFGGGGPGLVTGRRPHHLPQVGGRLRSRGLGRGR